MLELHIFKSIFNNLHLYYILDQDLFDSKTQQELDNNNDWELSYYDLYNNDNVSITDIRDLDKIDSIKAQRLEVTIWDEKGRLAQSIYLTWFFDYDNGSNNLNDQIKKNCWE